MLVGEGFLNAAETQSDGAGAAADCGADDVCPVFSFVRADAAVVAWGDKGDQVTLIQQKLKQYGYFSGTVDGVFGKQTYDAVVWFQRKTG